MTFEQKKRKRPSIQTLEKIYIFFDKVNEIDNLTRTNTERLREILEAMIAEGFTYIEAGDELRMLAKEKGINERSLRRWLPVEAKHMKHASEVTLKDISEADEDIRGPSDYLEAELPNIDNPEILRGIARQQFGRAEYLQDRVHDLEKEQEELHKKTETLQIELDRANQNLELAQDKIDELRRELNSLKDRDNRTD
jgi:hypothetical protein